MTHATEPDDPGGEADRFNARGGGSGGTGGNWEKHFVDEREHCETERLEGETNSTIRIGPTA